MFKAFATKIETLDSQLDKLKSDMEAETGELSVIRAKLYIDALERLRNTLEKDLPKVATDIQVVHTALNQAELDKLHGFDNDLQQKLQMATEQLAKLSLPATVNIPFTSTPNVSMIPVTQHQQQLASVGAPSIHQALPGASALPPPGLGTAVSGSARYYKPYKEHDYPALNDRVEEYGAWKREWQEKILPYMTPEIALRELNRCTPKSIDLAIFMHVDQAWRALERR